MPLTPFHFGPSLLLGYPLRQRLDLGTFLVASVILDVRATLVFFGVLSGPTHGPLHHTLLGAFAVALVFAGIVLLFFRQFPTVAQLVGSRSESATAIVLASVAGIWLHVILDAFTHSGMQLFYPLSGNPLYGLIDPFLLYGLCVLAFLLFVGYVGISTVRTVRKHDLMYYKSPERVWKVTLVLGVVVGMVAGIVLAAGAASTINAVSGIGSPDVTVESVNDTHAAVTWTTEKPTSGYLRISIADQCGPVWVNSTQVNRINDSSVTRTHLVTAPIYDLQSQMNQTNILSEEIVKWYQVEAVAVRNGEVVGTPVMNRNLSQACQ